MALKKSDLYRSLWQSCDELLGGMDASQYKDYILTLLFVKYVTDKAKSDPNSLIDVPRGGSFDDMVALKGDKEIGDRINKIDDARRCVPHHERGLGRCRDAALRDRGQGPQALRDARSRHR
jgi:type I restriction-modification system DNA methylase subunit